MAVNETRELGGCLLVSLTESFSFHSTINTTPSASVLDGRTAIADYLNLYCLELHKRYIQENFSSSSFRLSHVPIRELQRYLSSAVFCKDSTLSRRLLSLSISVWQHALMHSHISWNDREHEFRILLFPVCPFLVVHFSCF